MIKPLPRIILSSILLVFIAGTASSQPKLIKKLFSNEKDTSRGPSFLPVPVLGYSQESGLELGAISLYSFYTDRKDTLTRNSSITALASFTTKKQSSFFLKSDVWTPQNKMHFSTEMRYKNFPFNFYGIGNNTSAADEDLITQKLVRFTGAAEKKLAKSTYTGILAGYENYRYSDKETGGIFTHGTNFSGKGGGQLLYLGLNQIFDSRNSNTYTTRGVFLKISYSYAPKIFDTDDFNGSLVETDLRFFKTLGKPLVLGFNGTYNSIRGNKVPFYLMPQLGNDEMMRGYYSGRFRDETLVALQSELRYRPHARFGFVAFAGTGTVYDRGNFDLSELKPAYGAGFRYFFDPARGLSVRIDYGIGEKRPGETRQKGFYLSLGEAF